MTTTEYAHIKLNEDGVPYIAGTRIKVAHVAVDHFRAGVPADEIAGDYPPLTLGQVHSALAYYCDHKDEIDRYLAERDREVAEIEAGLKESNAAVRAKLRAAKAASVADLGRGELTPFARTLLELRTGIVASGVPLLSWDEIEAERYAAGGGSP